MIADLFHVAFLNNNAGNKPMGMNIAKFPKKLTNVTIKNTGLFNKSSR